MRLLALLLPLWLLTPPEAAAFCGFYVARADASLYNQASRVVIARDGDHTVVTMANDYQGSPREFAMVVPVPVVLQQGDVAVVDKAVIDAVDHYSAPRMAEYHDPDPCQRYQLDAAAGVASTGVRKSVTTRRERREGDLGVRIEAQYSVEEYDVLILSATESQGLATWLRREGYKIPDGAEAVLTSYIQQDLRFFVAKVDVSRLQGGGFQELRPLQVRYRSPRFGLPIRLGTVNARGPQDLIVFTLTPHGRVETTNYRNVPVPTDVEIPPYVQHDFARFYEDTFANVVRQHGRQVVVTEYAWPLSVMCDPCSADPLTVSQLTALGVSGIERRGGKIPQASFLTRLHLRYDAATFPSDLRFSETRDTRTAQGRFVIRHPFTGPATCEAGETYRRELPKRQDAEARTLASLTGWSLDDIRRRAGLGSSWDRPRDRTRYQPEEDESMIPEVGGRRYLVDPEVCDLLGTCFDLL